jgi:branched-chain amino acid transport system substrate-binding protein
MPALRRPVAFLVGLLIATSLAGALPEDSAAEPIRIGAVFPLSGSAAGLARQQELGVEIARDMVNVQGGIAGRPVELIVRDLASGADAPRVMAELKSDGVQAVIGSYASDLSIAASAAANEAGLVYWEAGAVADRLTGRGLPLVFRVGASGANLGTNSAAFAAAQLAPRIRRGEAPASVGIVAADDAYARSVAGAARTTALSSDLKVAADVTYRLSFPDWHRVMSALAAAKPDIIILASHIPDGIAFRRAMLAAHLRVAALIGSTMAECSPDFAGDLGADAVGVFASDRPTGGFQPDALAPAARELYDRLASAWVERGGTTSAPAADEGGDRDAYGYGAGDEEYTIQGPIESGSRRAGPTEEGLSGFTAAWVLFHHVLPGVASSRELNALAIASAARSLELPVGSLPNGAGLRFSQAPATLGQNERAAAVIWQWQAVRAYTFVWPSTYATGEIAFVPLPR